MQRDRKECWLANVGSELRKTVVNAIVFFRSIPVTSLGTAELGPLFELLKKSEHEMNHCLLNHVTRTVKTRVLCMEYRKSRAAFE